jgi:hypothetical protein
VLLIRKKLHALTFFLVLCLYACAEWVRLSKISHYHPLTRQHTFQEMKHSSFFVLLLALSDFLSNSGLLLPSLTIGSLFVALLLFPFDFVYSRNMFTKHLPPNIDLSFCLVLCSVKTSFRSVNKHYLQPI